MNIGLILRNLLVFIIFGTVLSFGASFSINNVSVAEGNSGTKNLTFTVTINAKCKVYEHYLVDYTTSNGTATAGSDYVAQSGTIDYYRASNKTSGTCGTKTISVVINGDTDLETDETFTITLSNPRGGGTYTTTISDNTGVGTIINDDTPTELSSAFTMRYKKNLKGNMKIIGNTVLSAADDGISSNSQVNLRYVDVDSDGTTFNSSTARLLDSAIVPTALKPNPAKVKWAGLYWSGYLHTYDASDGVQTRYTTLSTGADIVNVINNHTIKFRIGSNSYDIVNHTVLGQRRSYNTAYQGWSYGCFADVTSLMQGADPRANYGVANIPSMEGSTDGGTFDGLGNSGAWTLVVVYENDSVGEKTRNATVFDGFIKIENGSPQTINVSGFKTPKNGNVDSTLSVFANEGDRYITGDQFIFANSDGDKSGQSLVLSSTSGSNNYFNSSVTGVDTRNPNINNNNGIDIHTDQMGTSGYNIVSTNQTGASITMTSSQDTYFPVMVGFATELYMPKLCYDYTATIVNPNNLQEELLQKGSGDRTFISHLDSGKIKSKIFIRSLEGDFPYVESNLKVIWSDVTTPPPSTSPYFNFESAEVQNPNIYDYETPLYIDSSSGVYYIGIDRSGYHGVIDPFESLYAVSQFDSGNLFGKTVQVNAEVNASLALDETDPTSLTSYTFSTSDGTLEMCEGTFAYNPMWYQFNIETAGSSANNYTLGTQVTGTDFNLQVVSYTKDSNDKYTIRTSYTGAMEVELFEVPSFQSLGTYDGAVYSFDRICEDSSNGKEWGDGQRKFSYFSNNWRTSLPVTAADNKYAMRNSGVRIWVLMADYDGDGILTDIASGNNCTNTTGSCFKNLYANDAYYKTVDTCDTDCSSSSDESCYQCLKKYYSQPICSRDNFSVRPYGVELTAKSMTTEIQKNDTASLVTPNLLSGYVGDYTVEMLAKSANNIDPIGYYFKKLADQSTNIANDTLGDITEFFGLKFDNSKVNSGDYTKCADSNHKRFDPSGSAWKLENGNVGNYDIVLIDKDWTIVDQARYDYKPTFAYNGNVKTNDCTPGSTVLSGGANGPGCDVQSYQVNNNDEKYNLIPVKFVPAQIDTSGMQQYSVPMHTSKWAYMNRLAEDPNMGVQFIGNIIAKNALNVATSNFTEGCFAQDVNIFNQYSTTQVDDDGNVLSADTDGTPFTAGDIRLQQAHSYNNDSAFIVKDLKQSGQAMEFGTIPDVKEIKKVLIERDESIALAELSKSAILNQTTKTDNINDDYRVLLKINKDNFFDENMGNLATDIRYNIYKLYNVAVNPIKILFVGLKTQLLNSDGSQTLVWKAGYAPSTDLEAVTGVAGATSEIVNNKQVFSHDTAIDLVQDILNNAFHFIYGRVYTDLEEFKPTGKNVRGASTASSFSALAYSSTDPATNPVLSSILGNEVSGLSGWYLVTSHSVNNTDGEIASIQIKSAEQTNPTISPSNNILFNRNNPSSSGLTNNVTYSYSGTRSNKVVFDVYPSIWLRYNTDVSNNGLPQFVINFVDAGYNWVGKGNTGNVINVPVSPNAKYR